MRQFSGTSVRSQVEPVELDGSKSCQRDRWALSPRHPYHASCMRMFPAAGINHLAKPYGPNLQAATSVYYHYLADSPGNVLMPLGHIFKSGLRLCSLACDEVAMPEEPAPQVLRRPIMVTTRREDQGSRLCSRYITRGRSPCRVQSSWQTFTQCSFSRKNTLNGPSCQPRLSALVSASHGRKHSRVLVRPDREELAGFHPEGRAEVDSRHRMHCGQTVQLRSSGGSAGRSMAKWRMFLLQNGFNLLVLVCKMSTTWVNRMTCRSGSERSPAQAPFSLAPE